MKKKVTYVVIGLVMLMSLLSPVLANQNVQAQAGGPGCLDAAGAPVECTPTPSSGGGSGCIDAAGIPCTSTPQPGGDSSDGGGGNKPTKTPLPITNPTQASTLTPTAGPQITAPEFPLPEDGFLGSCTSDNFAECHEQFKCEDGLLVIKVDLYSGNGTKYDFYCIPHEEVPTINLPFTLPESDGKTEDNWTSGCYGDDVDECVENLASVCEADGGDLSVWYDDQGGAGVYCENESEAGQIAPTATPLSVAAPDQGNSTSGNEDWDEQCSWASCWAVDLACWMDGGSGYGIDDGAGGFVYHCDVPEESSSLPPSSWLPWVSIGVLVIVVAILLPAVQKVREAAKSTTQTKEHILLGRQNAHNSGDKEKTDNNPPQSPSKK